MKIAKLLQELLIKKTRFEGICSSAGQGLDFFLRPEVLLIPAHRNRIIGCQKFSLCSFVLLMSKRRSDGEYLFLTKLLLCNKEKKRNLG